MRRALRWPTGAALLLLLTACGSPTVTAEPEERGGTNPGAADPSADDPSADDPSAADPSGGLATTAEPDRYACESDADCGMGSQILEERPCCDTGLGGVPASRRWLAWRQAWLAGCDPADRAGGARCSCCPIPDGHYPPGPPLPCVFEVQCLQGRCTNRCE